MRRRSVSQASVPQAISFRTFAVILLLVLASAALTAQTVTRSNAKYTSPANGAEMYRAYCASCHGLTGQGDGPAAVAMKNPVPDLTKLSVKGEFPRAHVQAMLEGRGPAAHGNQEMPVWGPVFLKLDAHSTARHAQRVHNLTEYLAKMQEK